MAKVDREKAGKGKAAGSAGSKAAWQVHNTRNMTPEQIAALALSETIKVKEKPAKKRAPKGEAKAAPKPEQQEIETPKQEPAKRGRPTTFDQAIADQIIERITEGEPLRQICRDDNMPAWRTVYNWLAADKAFEARFACARDLGHDAIAEDTIKLIDEPPERTMTEFGDKVDPGYVQWQRNRVEQRLKLLAKWNPKKYGDKVEQTLKGDAENPVQVAAKVVIVPQKQTAAVETKPLTKDRE